MTKFHTNGTDLITEPETLPTGRIGLTTPKEKFPNARTLAAAFWASYFALHWLLILDIVEFTPARAFATIFFLSVATLLSISIAAKESSIPLSKLS